MEDGKMVIAVICTGNVCRSPMAERLLRHALDAESPPLNTFKVVSAGVSAFPGDPASNNAVRALEKVQLDLSDHRSRNFSDQLAETADIILTMTSSHMDIIHMRYPGLKAPVHRFREWIDSGSPEVPDPFGGSLNLYLDTRDSLAEAIPSILKHLKENL